MTGLEKIIGEINAAADAKIKEITDAAQKEADEIKAEAEKTATESCARLTRESGNRLEDQKRRAESAAELVKRQMLLSEKQTIISDTIQKAKEKIYNLSDSEYFDKIVGLVKKSALPGKGEIIFNEKDLSRLPSGFQETINKELAGSGKEITISKETRKIDGGFVMLYEGIEQNCSISSLFDTNIEDLQDKISSLLFN